MSDDDIGTVRWFGESWGAPVNDRRAKIPTPADRQCIRCRKWIRPGDQGITVPYYSADKTDTTVYHLDCFLREIGVPTSVSLQLHDEQEGSDG